MEPVFIAIGIVSLLSIVTPQRGAHSASLVPIGRTAIGQAA
jgi:hypothetical protein